MTLKIFSSRQWKEFKEIYCWSLRQRFGMIILYLALLFMALPMILLIVISNANKQVMSTADARNVAQNFYGSIRTLIPFLVVPLTLIFMLILAVMLFNYMHQKRSTDYFHSTPVGRTPLLLGKYFAGLTMIFVPLIINFGIVAIIDAANNFRAAVPIRSVFYDLLWIMLLITAAYSFTVLMAVCSGTTMDMVISTIVINIAYPIMIILCQNITNLILPGLKYDNDLFITNTSTVMFSPFVAAFFPFAFKFFYNLTLSASFVIWWCLFIPAVFAACIILYRKRKSESAENTFAFPLPKIIIRFVVTAAAGLGLGMILYSGSNQNNFNFFLGVFTGSLITHVTAEAIYSRGFKGMKKSLKYYGAFVVLFLIAYIPLSYGFFGYDTRVPATADVASVEVQSQYYQNGYDNTAVVLDENNNQLATITPRLTDKSNIDKIREFHKKMVENCKHNSYPYKINLNRAAETDIKYHLKNGSTISRSYYYRPELISVNNENADKFFSSIQNSDEYKSGNLINYLEPFYISRTEISNGNGSYELYAGNDIKLELIHALQQDIGEVKTMPILEQPYQIRLIYANGFVPSENSPLKKLIGNYDGKVHFGNTNYYYSNSMNTFLGIPSTFTHTMALIKKYGWIK